MAPFGKNIKAKGPVCEWAELDASTQSCPLPLTGGGVVYLVDDSIRRRVIMDQTTTLPAHPVANSSQTAKSRLNRLRQDHLLPMRGDANWTTVKVLTLDEICHRHIRWVLNRCGGNRYATAQLLGIGRTTLYRYLKRAASHQFRKPTFPRKPKDRSFSSSGTAKTLA